MTPFVLSSWLLLIRCELVMRLRGFPGLHELVRRTRVRPKSTTPLKPYIELCHGMEVACVFYIKQVQCLQRSAATALLMRRHGWNAEMVIGAQVFPFKSHAWVELHGAVVNDKASILDLYQVLQRC